MPHIHEKIDFTVEVFIVHKNKVLLRMHDKYKIWLSVGGHIELDENPQQAAIREIKEEVGLDVTLISPHKIPEYKNETDYKELIPPWYTNIHKINEKHQHIALIYFAISDTNVIASPVNNHEYAETRWVSIEELEKMDLVPNVLFYATEALKELGEK